MLARYIIMGLGFGREAAKYAARRSAMSSKATSAPHVVGISVEASHFITGGFRHSSCTSQRSAHADAPQQDFNASLRKYATLFDEGAADAFRPEHERVQITARAATR